jgi:hypothetical protein
MDKTSLAKLLSVVQSTSAQQTHLEVLHFYGDRVQVSNSHVWYDVASDLPQLDGCNIKAAEFVKAVSVMDSEKLTFKPAETSIALDDGSYSIRVPRMISDFPTREASSVDAEFMLSGDIVSVIDKARGFMGCDNWKQYTCNLYFKSGVCFASQNAALACFDARKCFEQPFDFSLNQFAVAAILLHAQPVLSIKPVEAGTYIIFDDGAWIFARSNEAAAPPFDQLIAGIDFSKLSAFSGSFVKAVKDMTDLSTMSAQNKNEILFTEQGVETADGEYHAVAKIGETFKQSRFDGKLMNLITGIATRIDLSCYPQRVPFANDDQSFYGVVMGMV